MDATPPHIVAEMKAMKEQMEVMMNALKGRVCSDLDDLVNRIDSPFTAAVNSFPLPHKFRMPDIDSYDEVKDPLDHLETFKTLMHLQGVADEIMCRAFPTTLKGPARVWFSRLTPNSISTFKELSAQFTAHFIGGHKYKKSTAYLMSISQWEDETLRSYIMRFNKEALSIDEADDKILVAAFTNGLQKDQVLMQIKDEGTLTFPWKLKGDPHKRSRDKYCCFHRDHDHDTANCYDLKQQIEALIRQGKLQKFVSKERVDPPPQEQHPQQDNERPRPPIGDIRMIVGGTAAGSSKKARKTYLRMVHNVQLTGFVLKIAQIESPIIGFSKEDARRLHHPHDDALVMTLQVGDFNIHRVLIDNDSSTDILYYPTFQQIRIDKERLVPTNAPLVGF
ncbi:uncharacterized protein LOC112032987 [Quercus suber]|uniref:uncharacterized protein LOC112032987 n=1 Tax=Quercus suber TaxID=58331 RepID=UPI0032DE5112